MKKPFSIERRHDELDAAEMMARPEVAQAVNESLAELKMAEHMYPDWPKSEVDQVRKVNNLGHKAFDDAVILCMDPDPGERDRLRRRLTQTAAMCIRCLINLEKQSDPGI